MILKSSSFLGLAISDRGITCAEVSASGDRATRKTAVFEFPSEAPLDKPEAAGHALLAFLRENRFSASRAVAGVPAKWLIATEKEIPPADEAQVQSMLRLQAERLAGAQNGEVIFDYAGRSDRREAGKVLLVGMLRQRVEQVERMLDTAGISVEAITSSSLALAITSGGGESLPMLVLARGGAEMVWRHQGEPRMLRHVSTLFMNGHGSVPMTSLGSDIRRAVAMTSNNGNGVAEGVHLSDGIGLTQPQVAELSDRLGVPVHGGTGEADPFAPARSLALLAGKRDLVPFDFTRSRLTPRPVRKFGRRSVWAAALGITVVIGLASLYVTVNQTETQQVQMQAQLDGMEKEIKDAAANVDRVNLGRSFFETRAPFLECAREVTLTFRDVTANLRDGEPLYLTSFTLRDGRRVSSNLRPDAKIVKTAVPMLVTTGDLLGKASSNTHVTALLERLKKNPNFTNVQLKNMADSGGRNREISFNISFTYTIPE